MRSLDPQFFSDPRVPAAYLIFFGSYVVFDASGAYARMYSVGPPRE